MTSCQKNILILNTSSFLWGLIFPFSIIVPFLIQHGYEARHFFYLKAIFSLATILLEVPAGVISDRLGRKKTLVCSYFILSLAMFYYGISSSLIHFALAEIAWALGMALYSGTDSAFYFEVLKAENKSKKFKKLYGNSLFLRLIALALANFLSGFLAKKSFFVPFFLCSISLFLGGVICLFLKENKCKTNLHAEKNWQNFLKTLQQIFREKILKTQIIFAALVGAFSFTFFRLGQPFLVEIFIPIEFFGVILSLQKIISALSAKFAYFFEKRLKEKLFLVIILFLLFINFLSFAFFKNNLGIFFIVFAGVAYNFSIPWINEKINQRVSNDIRASVISVQNCLQKLFFVVLGSLSGLLLSHLDVSSLSFVMTILIVLLLVPISILSHQKQKFKP